MDTYHWIHEYVAVGSDAAPASLFDVVVEGEDPERMWNQIKNLLFSKDVGTILFRKEIAAATYLAMEQDIGMEEAMRSIQRMRCSTRTDETWRSFMEEKVDAWRREQAPL